MTLTFLTSNYPSPHYAYSHYRPLLSHITINLSFLQSFMQESRQFTQEIPATSMRE